jgi:hypothetical protein
MAKNRALFGLTMLLLTYTISEAVHGMLQHGATYLLRGNHAAFIAPAQLANQPGIALLAASEPIVTLSWMIRAVAGLEKAKVSYKMLLLLHLLGYNLFRHIWHNL